VGTTGTGATIVGAIGVGATIVGTTGTGRTGVGRAAAGTEVTAGSGGTKGIIGAKPARVAIVSGEERVVIKPSGVEGTVGINVAAVGGLKVMRPGIPVGAVGEITALPNHPVKPEVVGGALSKPPSPKGVGI
ncbi:MAG: hypothetical protein AB1847_05790, partial [bacterium]